MPLQDEIATAQVLNINPNTLAKWRSAGEGPPFIRVGRAVRYDPADVQAWLESRKVRTSSKAA